ncbi:50S ribosomal protein L39e [Candidatus Micrarchaeota archaeon]|nr:50S ribosomal protein L39e [Candidatus Micrarchaeota archaeon]
MATNKTARRKQQLALAQRRNRRMPLFVVAKTKRRLRFNRLQRNWLSKKLKLKDD